MSWTHKDANCNSSNYLIDQPNTINIGLYYRPILIVFGWSIK